MVEIPKRKVEIREGQYAINVKSPCMPKMPEIEGKDRHEVEQLLNDEQEFVNETVAQRIKEIEESMQKQYPRYDIKLSWEGRSGGWIVMRGRWQLSANYWAKDDHYDRDSVTVDTENNNGRYQIEKFIIPTFERHIHALLKEYYCLWEQVIRDVKEGYHE